MYEQGFCIKKRSCNGCWREEAYFQALLHLQDAFSISQALWWRCCHLAAVMALVLCAWPQLSQLGTHSWLFLLALSHSAMLLYAFSFSFYVSLFYCGFLFLRIFSGSSLGPGLRVGSSEEESPLLLLEVNLLPTSGPVETQLSAESM